MANESGKKPLTGPVHPGIAGLTPYRPGKPVEELTRELGITDVIKLASNENPRGPGPLVRERMARAARDLSRYPDGGGFSLKAALSRSLGVTPAQLTLGNGSNDVLDLAARVTILPGAEAVVSAHAFVVYRLAVAACGGTLVEVPARDYGADLKAMAGAITDRTAIVFLANPNNPTGTWVSEAALVDFLEAVPERVWVVLDEAYAEYVEESGYPDGLALLKRYPNLIVTRTFSKIHALAALRVGYAVSSTAVADLMNRARQPFNVNALALAAAEGALADQEFVMTSRALNREGKALLGRGFDELGLSYIPSAGNFLTVAVPDAAGTYQSLLREGVIVRPIAEYGLPDHLRVSIGLPEENERFLHTLRRLLAAR
ncbi:MAG TPA: histidinol-phosphate transaminase [Pseudomonadales bacterium]